MTGAITAAFLALSAWAAYGQEAAPRFEVASVKPSPPYPDPLIRPGMFAASRIFVGSGILGGPGTDSPGQIQAIDCPLLRIVATAYELGPSQLRAPDWLYFEKYDILAKVPPGSSRHRVNQMLQQLLTERFQLAIHWKKQDGPVYALVVAKQGPKLQPAEDSAGEPETLLPGQALPYPTLSGNNVFTLTARHESMKRLAATLSQFVDRPVVDRTELSGNFDFSLAWVANVNLPRPKKSDLPPGIKSVPLRVDAAVQIQLGLKLEHRKAPLDVLIVDSALKVPVEN